MIEYHVETWQNGSMLKRTTFQEDEMKMALKWWVHMTEMVDTDVEVRLISPSC